MIKMNVVLKTAVPAVAALLLSGCNVGPKYARPQYPAPPAYRGADNAAVSSDAQQASLGDKKWSEVFQDPELQQLITTALANNYDVRIAARRILEAQAQVKIAGAARLPQINVGGTGLGAELPSSLGSNIGSPLVAGSFSMSASWTPDFWGLYSKQIDSARDLMLAQQWAQRAVKVTLVSQVASTYLQLRTYDQQLQILKQSLQVRQDQVGLTQKLSDAGSVPLSDLRQAQQLLYQASSQVPQLEQQIQTQENAMALLLGQNPGPIAHTAPNALAAPPQDVPVGLPSQLLERRPDIQQAEETLKSYNAQVGIARAQFFPQISISGSAGVGGDTFSNIFSTDSRTIYGMGSLTQAIFAGGKLRGQLQLSQQQKEEMVLSYQKTIAGAFRDVSNALISLNKQHEYRLQQEQLAFAAKDATRLARLRYRGGATSYLEVLTTDSTSLQAQLNLVTAQQGEATALVQLYGALGGGWQ